MLQQQNASGLGANSALLRGCAQQPFISRKQTGPIASSGDDTAATVFVASPFFFLLLLLFCFFDQLLTSNDNAGALNFCAWTLPANDYFVFVVFTW